MLLVVTYSKEARQTLRNVCNAHEETVVRRFGRAVLLEANGFGAFLAIRMLAKHGGDVQIERTEPFVPRRDVPDEVRDAALAYVDRDHPATPYGRFAAGETYPSKATLSEQEL